MARPPLSEVADALSKLNQNALNDLVTRRLSRQQPQYPLPPLYRNEDPADIFVDVYRWLREEKQQEFVPLKKAAAEFVEEITNEWSQEYAQQNSEAIMEAVWLCAMTENAEAAGSIAILGLRDEAWEITLPNGQRLCYFALRVLVGFLAPHTLMIFE